MSDDLLEMFKEFLEDRELGEMYITGVAGTGKTTSLAKLIEYCIENRISTVTCAYTHKAVDVLRSKLPKDTERNTTKTLHSYLKKVPTINDKATKVQHVDSNAIVAESDIVKVIFIDEFSMIGERDYVDINTMQWSTNGVLLTKVVYIGDPNQLPPVKDASIVTPAGKYHFNLTKIHRQADDNPLIDTLLSINDMINGSKPVKLKEHSNFLRGCDIVTEYKKCKTSKVLLAYTNEKVQELNIAIEGRDRPNIGDSVFVSTLKQFRQVVAMDKKSDYIRNIRGDVIELNSKYNTLETLHLIEDVEFFTLQDDELNDTRRAVVFGHYNYLYRSDKLAKEAVRLNKKITNTYKVDPTIWCRTNGKTTLAKERNEAWKRYLSFKECVVCVDFSHAVTVHKSQGSTYENVFLDIEDLGRCADNDYELYLKLMYVAVSRASNTVYTN